MAEVIRTPVREVREVREIRDVDNGNALGWAVALILLLAIVAFGIFIWPGLNFSAPSSTTNPGTNVNVTLPNTGTNPGQNTTQPSGSYNTNNSSIPVTQ